MNEYFLHYLWSFRLYDRFELKTTSGHDLEVVHPGTHNHDAGPDFSTAKIRIAGTLWGGNVEIHLRSSDWFRHSHQKQKNYESIILHVVHIHDRDIFHADGTLVPVLQLKDKIDKGLLERYQLLQGTKGNIPCHKQLPVIDQFYINSWLDRLVIDRLEDRSIQVKTLLKANNNDWEETFYQSLARHFGASINVEPFEALAKSLPNKLLAKHKNNSFQIEALLFGQAGLLESEFHDDYPNRLKTEYLFLQKKYDLIPMEGHVWKFMRMRPSNFPTIRIAQLAQLISRSSHLFSKMLESSSIGQLRELLNNATSSYWLSHYRFDKASRKSRKGIGINTLDRLLINTVATFLFVYGSHKKEQQFIDRAVNLLETLPAEQNKVTDLFENLNVKAINASRSQALLQLKKEYCDKKRCLDCGIGAKVLNFG